MKTFENKTEESRKCLASYIGNSSRRFLHQQLQTLIGSKHYPLTEEKYHSFIHIQNMINIRSAMNFSQCFIFEHTTERDISNEAPEIE